MKHVQSALAKWLIHRYTQNRTEHNDWVFPNLGGKGAAGVNAKLH